VCDFGLSRMCHGEVSSSDLFGTISHMPPELLIEGRVGLSGGNHCSWLHLLLTHTHTHTHTPPPPHHTTHSPPPSCI
jgi:hypothetical protein